MNESTLYVMPKYLVNFQCTAAACPEDCCHGWQVHVDRSTYDKLKDAMTHPRKQRERFKQVFRRTPEKEQTSINYASIVLQPDSRCPFLDEHRLCEIHRCFGPSHLSQVCRGYPRHSAQVGQRTELSASLSCPEITRACLLDPEGADLVEVQPKGLERDALNSRRWPVDSFDPYVIHLDEVRQVIFSLLSIEGASVAERLFFAACFADHLTPNFSLGDPNASTEFLAEAVKLFSQVATLEELQRQFRNIDDRIDFSLTLLQTLSTRWEKLSPQYLRLLRQTWSNYNLHPEETEAAQETPGPATFAEVGVRYLQRKQLLHESLGERLEQYFCNYARNFWFTEWHTDSPNLLEHCSKLLVRMAILRFLLISHPRLNPLLEQLASGPLSAKDLEEARQRLDDAAVETFYQFSRGVEHSQIFLRQIQQTLAGQGLDGLTLLTLLLKF